MKIPPDLTLIKGGTRTASSPDEAQRNPGNNRAIPDFISFHPGYLLPPLQKGDRGGFVSYLLITLFLHGCGGGGFNKLPQSPSVTTLSVNTSDISPKSTTLTGVVNPNSDPTIAWFEWGTDEIYSNKTAETDVGNGAEAVNVSERLENQLTPNTLYYYRLVARNGLDIIYDEGMVFTTTAIPPPTLAPIRTANEIQNINCTLMGITVNPNGYDTHAWFEFGLDTDYGLTTTAASLGAGTINLDFTQAIPNYALATTYHYHAVAQNEGGTVTSEDNQCTTPAAGVIPPTDPPSVTTGSASNITPVSITLNGEGNPLGTDSVGWFEWGSSTSYGNLTSAQSMGNGTTTQPYTQDIAGLQPDTEYHYRAVARGYGNTPIYGSDEIIRTARSATVNTAIATSLTPTGLTMNAAINPNGFATSAWFDWGMTSAYGDTTAERLVGSTNNSQSFSETLAALTPATQYHFRIVARGFGNVIIEGADQTATTQSVPPPAVTTASPSLVTVDRCAFNGTVNPNGFDTDAWFEWGETTSYGTPTGSIPLGTGSINVPLSAVVTGLAPDTSYYYRLVAQNSGGLVHGSDAVCTTSSITPVTPVISNIVVSNITSSSANISWDTTVQATSRIDYGQTTGYGFFTADNALTTSHEMTLANLSPSTLYHYKITGIDQSNNIHESPDAIFTTADAPLTTINVAQSRAGVASSTKSGYSTSAPLNNNTAQTPDTNAMWAPANANAGQWYAVDLGNVFTIDQVKLTMGYNSVAFTTTRAFTIDTSVDGSQWNTQANVANNSSFIRTVNFAPVDARFVRFTIAEGSALDGLSYLIELEAYIALFVTSGTYISAIHDLGVPSNFTTINWTETLNGQTITIKARTCDDPNCLGEPGFNLLSNLSNGGALSDGGGATDGHQYIQYQVSLVTTNIFKTPALESITISTSNGSWLQTDDGTTDTGFNLEGNSKNYTQVTNLNGGSVQLSKPPLGGTGQDGAYTCLTGTCTNLPGGIYNFTSFYIAQGAIVDVPKGGPALVIYSQGDVVIDGILSVNGATNTTSLPSFINSPGGAGGAMGGKGGYGGSIYPEAGYGAGSGYAHLLLAGAGGGFGGAGGAGYDVSVTDIFVSAGGIRYGNALIGGSGGGGGTSTSYVPYDPIRFKDTGYYYGGDGGGGGGAIRISSGANILIGPSGQIQADGGNGAATYTYSNIGDTFTKNYYTSGGGGSGGGIQLEATSITNNGIITARGGDSELNINAMPGGGGGGGRITFYDNDGVISGTTGQINVDGGTGFVPGGQGVVDVYKLY